MAGAEGFRAQENPTQFMRLLALVLVPEKSAHLGECHRWVVVGAEGIHLQENLTLFEESLALVLVTKPSAHLVKFHR